MKHLADETEFEDEELQIKPLTAEEAAIWRKRQPKISMWRVLGWQLLAGVLVAAVAWLLAGSAVAWSAAYGALAIVVPAAFFAWALSRSGSAPNALAKLFVWEFVKLVLCIAMLAAAPFLVPNLSWLALLAGVVVTMKTYWVALVTGRASVQKPIDI